MRDMQKIFITIFIAVVFIGAGVYLYTNPPQNKNQRSGEYSQNTQNYPEAKASEIVELKDGDTYSLTASVVKKNINGSEVRMFAYNGSIPGPTIKIFKGGEITLHFINNTDVDSTIHSHGVRVENQFDGVPDVTQKAVKPGESFTYKLRFPDEGVYWYHPHIREDYAQELGLYGNFIVTSTDTNYWSPVNREIPLVLDDILIENNKIAPFNTSLVDHALMGRFGNVMLVNGDTNYRLEAKQGEVMRFYLTNVANTRTFNINIPRAKIKLVGGDNGKVEKEEFADFILLSPSERVVVEVYFEKPGTYALEHKTPEKTYTLAKFAVSSEKADNSYANNFAALRTNQDISLSINQFRPLLDKQPDKKITLTLDMMGNQMGMRQGTGNMMGQHQMMDESMMDTSGSGNEKIEWEDDMAMMNTNATSKMIKWKIIDSETNKENEDIDWNFKVGDKVKLSISNDPKSEHPMQHPIHIHGQRFLVLSTNGVKNSNLVWKDTTLVQKGDTVELLVDMENPGSWVIHCHIPEHMEAGMMSKFKVM